jgi:predicted nucleotidyltransferase
MTRDEAIAEITHRLIDFYQPVRIYLFGSVARGEDGPDSDLDFLVVVLDDGPRTNCAPVPREGSYAEPDSPRTSSRGAKPTSRSGQPG